MALVVVGGVNRDCLRLAHAPDLGGRIAYAFEIVLHPKD